MIMMMMLRIQVSMVIIDASLRMVRDAGEQTYMLLLLLMMMTLMVKKLRLVSNATTQW